MGLRTVKFIAGQVNKDSAIRKTLQAIGSSVRDFHIGLNEPEHDSFYIEINSFNIPNFEDYEEQISKSPLFGGITRYGEYTVLIKIKEYYKGSVLKFLDGKYSEMYPENEIPIIINSTHSDAIEILLKSQDLRERMQHELDVVIDPEAELDNKPDWDAEVFFSEKPVTW